MTHSDLPASTIELFDIIPDAESARLYLEKRRWHGSLCCPLCGAFNKITARNGRRLGYYRCHDCASEFTVRTGTILERSHVPLDKWIHAIYLLVTARKKVSSIELSKEISVTPKTAFSMLRRLNEACGNNYNSRHGIAEVNETRIEENVVDAIMDKVLSYRPAVKSPLKVIAGEPDRPLAIGDIEIPCYVLEGETRVLTQRGVFTAFDARRGGHHRSGAELPRFMASKALSPHISDELRSALTTPILFTLPGGGPIAHGYPATLLPDICDVILSARSYGDLVPRQLGLADRSELLMRGLARVGVIALVDEATGYQRIREERALATILEKFLDQELHPWTRTFPFTFYEQIFRLKGWGSVQGVKRPSVIGHYTNDLVYKRIAPGVFDELRERNPMLPQGWRRNRHHQWFTPKFGHPRLKEHLEGVTALMRAAPNWETFKRSLDRAYPKPGTQFPMLIA